MSSDLKDRILERLSFGELKRFYSQYFDKMGKASSSGNIKVPCCFHEDADPSLSINLFTGLYRCFGCDAKGDIFSFIQFKNNCDFPTALKDLADFLGVDPNLKSSKKVKSKKTKPKKGDLDCTYNYVNLKGEVIHQTVRYKNPKSFSQRIPSPDKPDEYIWSLRGVETIPYNLPEVDKADTVYIVEGEKDSDRLKQIGLTATCNAMGSGKWPDHLTPYFKNKNIIILPDNDQPGKDHAKLVANKLSNVARSIKIIELPNLPESGDIFDWLSAGNTKADLQEVVNKTTGTYENHIDFLNKKHAAIMIGGSFLIMNFEWDSIFNRPDLTFSSSHNFLLRYQNRRIPNPKQGRGIPKEISIAKDWLNSPDRKEYSRLVFAPNNNLTNGEYNMWKGFAFEPKKGNWNRLNKHILNNICGGNSYIYEWIITWMARIVQEPGGKRPGKAIVLRGAQGVGKGCFLSCFGELFGNHKLHITNQKQLIGRFNNHLKDVLFLFVDEGYWAGDKSNEGSLKGLITEDTLAIESKGKDVVSIKNHINLCLASNNEWIVPSGFFERRFVSLEVSEAHKQDIPYFKKIYDQMENGGYEAMLYDLLKWDLKSADLTVSPVTNAGIDQVFETMDDEYKFWYEILQRGKFFDHDLDWANEVYCKKLYEEYVDFCNKLGSRHKKTPSIFGKKLKKLCPGRDRFQRTMSPDGSRDWYYYFPDLPECRENFEKTIGKNINLDWESGGLLNI